MTASPPTWGEIGSKLAKPNLPDAQPEPKDFHDAFHGVWASGEPAEDAADEAAQLTAAPAIDPEQAIRVATARRSVAQPATALSQDASDASIASAKPGAKRETSSPWVGEGMDSFLAAAEKQIVWLVEDFLAPGALTEIFAPRGIGKSLLADYWAVEAARRGLRVLILDRDNSRRTLRTRLRGFGAAGLQTLKVISREKCPPLTMPDEWAAFPYADYDLVIVDSMDAMAEGIGEQDSSKPAKVMAVLLDIVRRENGPAVLLLGNTIKTAAHSRGSGVVEDRADMVYEVRDATNFRPTGKRPWIEELPAQGAPEWAARATRRKGRTKLRLALVPSKSRLVEEPASVMLEISTAGTPWTVADVTAQVDADSAAESERATSAKAAKIAEGRNLLLGEIDRRLAGGESPILKRAAEAFLTAEHTRKEAQTIIADACFAAIPGTGKGHPMELHRAVKMEDSGEMHGFPDPCKNAGTTQADFARQHPEHSGEMDPSRGCMNIDDSKPLISPKGSPLTGGQAPADEPGTMSDGQHFEGEV